ncbi:MAG: acyltransferase [Lachnospiraceae bacterium]|nr:acyltransferase [Lachnospiraceae bacterium]
MQRKKELLGLNGLKVIFCIMIIMLHYRGNLSYAKVPVEGLWFFFYYGGLGVEFFFILSGFLTAYNYEEKIGTCSLATYWFGRTKKLFPYVLYSVTMDAICCFLDHYFGTGIYHYINNQDFWTFCISINIPLRALITGVTGVVYSGVIWFVCDLALCYFIWGVVKKLTNNSTKNALWIFAIFLTVGMVGQTTGTSLWFLPDHLFKAISCFFIGVMIYHFREKYDTFKISCLSMFVIGVLAFLTIVYDAERVFGDVRLSFSIFVIPALILIVLDIPLASKAFSCKVFRCASTYTTAIYVTHANVIHLFHILQIRNGWRVQYDTWYVFLLIFVLCIITGISSEWIVKKILVPFCEWITPVRR